MALYNKGNALFVLGKYDAAIEWYDRALEIEPENVDALDNKGVALFVLGKYGSVSSMGHNSSSFLSGHKFYNIIMKQ